MLARIRQALRRRPAEPTVRVHVAADDSSHLRRTDWVTTSSDERVRCLQQWLARSIQGRPPL